MQVGFLSRECGKPDDDRHHIRSFYSLYKYFSLKNYTEERNDELNTTLWEIFISSFIEWLTRQRNIQGSADGY